MVIPNPLIITIDKYHEDRQSDNVRYHIGPSSCGDPCDRSLWLKFRWVVPPSFSGRMLRLFRRGRNEEATVVEDLKYAGIDIRETGNNQRRVEFGGHVSGSIDGIIMSGVPESPKKQHVFECKTHSKKSFNSLEKYGVLEAKPEHYGQMQCYMHGAGIDRALYSAVCKDDDRYYFERVEYDQVVALKIIARLKDVSLQDRLPPPISGDPDWYQCKMCSCHGFCHEKKAMDYRQVSCRSCAHVTAMDDGTWHCKLYDTIIAKEHQREGCRNHVIHPDVSPWELDMDKSTETTAAYVTESGIKINGKDGLDSKILLRGLNVANVVEVFGGEIVEND